MINRIKIISFLLLVLAFNNGFAKNKIVSIQQEINQGSMIFKPKVDFKTSNDIKEAIDSGVRIRLIFKANLMKQKDWWFDETLDKKVIIVVIYTFKLGQLYVAKNLETQEIISFNSYEQLLQNSFDLVSFAFETKPQDNIYLKSRIMLDHRALPTTMQVPVIFDGEWDINTDWFEHEVLVK